jgi:Tfp pilus assembly protein PilO
MAVKCKDEDTSAVTIAHCDQKHRTLQNLLKVVLTLMGLLIVVVGFSIAASSQASQDARESMQKAGEVKTAISIHEARQNGSLENINNQLTDVREDMSDVRADVSEMRKTLHEALKQ